jgi:hypothetical protein
MATVTIRGLDPATLALLSDNTALEAEDDSGASVYITIGMIRSLLATGPAGLTFTGDVTGSGTTSVVLTIPAGSVDLAQLADLPAKSLIGRGTGVGVPQALSLGSGLDIVAGVLDTVTSIDISDGLAVYDHRAFGGF